MQPCGCCSWWHTSGGDVSLRASVYFTMLSFLSGDEQTGLETVWVSEWPCRTQLPSWRLKDIRVTAKLTFVDEHSWALGVVLLASRDWWQGDSMLWNIPGDTLFVVLSAIQWSSEPLLQASHQGQDSLIHVLQITTVPCEADAYSKVLWLSKRRDAGLCKGKQFPLLPEFSVTSTG